MANVLNTDKQIAVIVALAEASSICAGQGLVGGLTAQEYDNG
jgi:hypothetical protein